MNEVDYRDADDETLEQTESETLTVNATDADDVAEFIDHSAAQADDDQPAEETESANPQ